MTISLHAPKYPESPPFRTQVLQLLQHRPRPRLPCSGVWRSANPFPVRLPPHLRAIAAFDLHGPERTSSLVEQLSDVLYKFPNVSPDQKRFRCSCSLIPFDFFCS